MALPINIKKALYFDSEISFPKVSSPPSDVINYKLSEDELELYIGMKTDDKRLYIKPMTFRAYTKKGVIETLY